MKEVWKDISGFEGKYMVSNFGHVKSLGRYCQFGNRIRPVPEKILKNKTKKSGYKFVILYYEPRKYKCFHVHRLVAENFVEGYRENFEVNHIDGNKSNNNADNLEWVNRSKNIYHSYHELKRKAAWSGKTGKNNPLSTIIEQRTEDNQLVRVWYGFAEIQRELGIPEATLRRLVKNGDCHYKGYIWVRKSNNRKL